MHQGILKQADTKPSLAMTLLRAKMIRIIFNCLEYNDGSGAICVNIYHKIKNKFIVKNERLQPLHNNEIRN